MELRHLRYFLAVADERQFTRAAAKLHIQQPPLSQQIQALESEIGFALFTRVARGLDQAVTKGKGIADGRSGSVRIALTSSSAFHPLAPAAIRAFREACPDIAIDLNEINAAEIIEGMVSGRIDAAILRKPSDTPEELRFDLLLQESMVLVLPVGHRLLQRRGKSSRMRPVALSALADEAFIFVRRPGARGMYADFIDACEAAGFTPRVVTEVPRMLSAINLVAAGTGVTIVPASMQRYQQESVVYCPMESDEAITAPLHLVTRRDAGNPAAVRFAQTMLEFARARQV
jgi:DNA-binding transcriptional LysR family regulator